MFDVAVSSSGVGVGVGGYVDDRYVDVLLHFPDDQHSCGTGCGRQERTRLHCQRVAYTRNAPLPPARSNVTALFFPPLM